MSEVVEVHSLFNIVPDPSSYHVGGYREPDYCCEFCGEGFHTEAEDDAHAEVCHEAKKYYALYSDEGESPDPSIVIVDFPATSSQPMDGRAEQ